MRPSRAAACTLPRYIRSNILPGRARDRWMAQIFAGQHEYKGWVPEDVIDQQVPDGDACDMFAMGRFWHGDAADALVVTEDMRVGELTAHIAAAIGGGLDVGLVAGSQVLSADDYVGASVMNHQIDLLVGGVDTGVSMNDGHHVLP